jgi:N-acetylmuramoyl-L-alanine amidase
MPRLCTWFVSTLLVVTAGGCASHKAQHRNAQAVDWESDELHLETGTATNALVRTLSADSAHAVAPRGKSTTPSNRIATATGQTNVHQTWIPLNGWCSTEGLPVSSRVSGGGPVIYELRSSTGTMLLTAGSRVASWDGVEFRLGFAPAMIDAQFCVHRLDLQKTVQPLIGNALPALAKSNLVVVIDPGHGGEDPGASSLYARGSEKDFTLDWALRLALLLHDDGWTVFLTRTNDIDLSLSNRVSFADSHNADLFVSLHFNSAGTDEGQYGVETYCLTPTGMTSTVTRGFSDDSTLTFTNNAFDTQNLVLAARVHRALLTTGARDRGVRHARFPAVLRGQHRPAILVEGGYLSNQEESSRIALGTHRQKLAEAIAAAIRLPAAAPTQLSEESGSGK